MSKPFDHFLEVYGLHLHLATDVKAWRKLNKRVSDSLHTKKPDASGLVEIGTFTTQRGMHMPHVYIFINVGAHEDIEGLVDTIAHEASHAAGAIAEHIGHPIAPVDEPVAYLVGWITRWLYIHCAPLLEAQRG